MSEKSRELKIQVKQLQLVLFYELTCNKESFFYTFVRLRNKDKSW